MKSYKIPLGGKFPYEVKSSLLKKGAYLDHNHTHFLLIHDGSQGKYGAEINFRSMFEKWVMENDSGGKIIVNSSLPSWLALEHFQQVLTTTCNSTIKKGYQGFWFVWFTDFIIRQISIFFNSLYSWKTKIGRFWFFKDMFVWLVAVYHQHFTPDSFHNAILKTWDFIWSITHKICDMKVFSCL